jgi:WD40-like Beta Propeller Repeat
MTEQLHDLLARIADQAGPGSSDPTLWGRARRARRRDRAVRASAAALTVLALVGAIAVGLGTRHAPPPAKQTPTPHETGVGIPSTVRGIHGDGGLDLETDLAVGPASVAIANQSGAFVITAADGVYHRLRLPGFDPTAFNDNQTGIALSPDGTRLAYGWRATKSAGSASGPMVGTRILDLRTGALQKIPADPVWVADKNLGVATYGYGWSPNGRYLAFEIRTKNPDAANGHLYIGFDPTPGARYRSAPHGPSTPFFLYGSDARLLAGSKPMTLADPQHVARAGERDPAEGPFLVFGGTVKDGVIFDPFPLPGDADWNVGRFTPDGRRILLQPDRVGTGLLLVTDSNPLSGRHSATPLPLHLADWPDGAKIDVLGWVGPDHALAMINRGTGTDTWEPNGELILVDVSSVPGAAVSDIPVDFKVVGKVEPGDPASTYSFAIDFATVDTPTRDFDNASSTQKSDPNRDGALPSQDRSEGDTTQLVTLTAAGLIVLAAISLALARSRRKRSINL